LTVFTFVVSLYGTVCYRSLQNLQKATIFRIYTAKPCNWYNLTKFLLDVLQRWRIWSLKRKEDETECVWNCKLRRSFGPKREEEETAWRELYNKGFHKSYWSTIVGTRITTKYACVTLKCRHFSWKPLSKETICQFVYMWGQYLHGSYRTVVSNFVSITDCSNMHRVLLSLPVSTALQLF